jgi:mannose/cellobiose epimerase-like protein (N-acyl-D-glucosamine 2-epimerase family)
MMRTSQSKHQPDRDLELTNAAVLLEREAACAHVALRAWLFESALPFWSTVGVDRSGSGFVEHLDLSAGPADVPYKRVRVQARQIFVFSRAHMFGWPGALKAATAGYGFLTRHARRPDGAWVRALGVKGDVLDPTADLYDLAFVLFALAWYARATGSAEALDHAYRTLDWVKRSMSSPTGGFYNAMPISREPRQQNPHMHLLEAVLALFKTTHDDALLKTADTLVDLFRTRFFDSRTGSLGEFFTDDWRWAEGDAGTRVEPGHHYEWVWLLDQYERLSNRIVEPEKSALYAFANRWGCDQDTGLVIDAVDRAGAVRDASVRIWPQTEAIKAHVVMAEQGNVAGAQAGAAIAQITSNLLQRFFVRPPAGTWTDHFAAGGAVKGDRIPSSTLYHIVMAFSELDRIFGKAAE